MKSKLLFTFFIELLILVPGVWFSLYYGGLGSFWSYSFSFLIILLLSAGTAGFVWLIYIYIIYDLEQSSDNSKEIGEEVEVDDKK